MVTREGSADEGTVSKPVDTVSLQTPLVAFTPPEKAIRWTLHVLQLGAIAVVLIASTYKAFELDRFFVPKEMTLHITALAAVLLSFRVLRRTMFTWLDLLLVLYLAFGLFSAFLATNVWLGARALAISASGIAIFWGARAVREAGLERPLLTALAVAVVLGALTSCLQAYGVRTELFSLNRSPGGTLGNRNFVAHLGAFGMPVVLLVALRASRTSGFVMGALGAAIVTASLVLTRSRAGWLAVTVAMLTTVVAMLLSPPLRRSRLTWRRLGGILALSSVGVGAAIVVPNSLRWRSENPYLESMTSIANYQEGSGRGRLVQYGRSLRMAARYPVLGVGPGNWSVKYPAHAARRDPSLDRNEPGTTSNPWPSSDWIAFVSERGFAATLALAAALLGILLRGLGQARGARDVNEGLAAVALLATLVAANVAGAFDAVLLLALPALLVWATLGALWTPTTTPPSRLALRVRRPALVWVVALAGLGAARSTAQLIAMGMYSTRGNASSLTNAARIDPGNYRVRVRLARGGRGLNRTQRCKHARAAHDLFPSASEARDLSRRCSR